ncbi:MAG: SUMF1/EgtB/PvdO family nonheme iron enzyme [Deltaproteobacteria bacterium]|nr:SUMF1/EgtB/PvdO family nonheme iron enzyme [Deltaproteobacteria bacterium]
MKFATKLASLLLITPLFLSTAYGAALDELDKELGIGSDSTLEEQKKPEEKKIIPPFKMVLIKGGCFDMGDVAGEGDEDEKPVHQVCVSDYYMAETEVTQELFEAVMGYNPIKRITPKAATDPQKPVVYVNWHLANEFIKKLNEETKSFYRLPTEAEWEYAARSGGKKEKWPGINNEAELGDYAWFADNSDDIMQKVKQKKPNGLGIYDMAGNAWEWVEDNFDSEYYRNSPKKDPYGPDVSQYRSLRGGSFIDQPIRLRSTYRYALEPTRRIGSVGFRLAE